MALWRELRAIGYAFGPKMVQRWMAENRTKPAPRTARKWLKDATAAMASSAPSDAPPASGPALPSPKQLAWLLVRPAETWTATDTMAVQWVEQDNEATLVASLARRFTSLVRRCGTSQPTRP